MSGYGVFRTGNEDDPNPPDDYLEMPGDLDEEEDEDWEDEWDDEDWDDAEDDLDEEDYEWDDEEDL